MDSKLKELRQLIHSHLSECDTIITPTICEMKDTPKGKSQLEENILTRCLKKGITVWQAINEIEKEYNPNLNND